MNEPIISDEILRRYQEHIIKKYRYGVNLHEIALVLAAQADLGSVNEVTDEAVKAAYNIHNSASEHCKFNTDFERCKAAIEAALKEMK